VENKKYQILDHNGSGIKVFILSGEWQGVTILFDNFNKNGDKGTYTYEFFGLPSNKLHLLNSYLNEEQESSILFTIREIASGLFQILASHE
jgi:hypothetical protein